MRGSGVTRSFVYKWESVQKREKILAFSVRALHGTCWRYKFVNSWSLFSPNDTLGKNVLTCPSLSFFLLFCFNFTHSSEFTCTKS